MECHTETPLQIEFKSLGRNQNLLILHQQLLMSRLQNGLKCFQALDLSDKNSGILDLGLFCRV